MKFFLLPDLQVSRQLVAKRLSGWIHCWIGAICLTDKWSKVDDHSFSLLQHLREDEAHHDSGGSTVDVDQPFHVSATHHVLRSSRQVKSGCVDKDTNVEVVHSVPGLVETNHPVSEVCRQRFHLDCVLLLDGRLHRLQSHLVMADDEYVQAPWQLPRRNPPPCRSWP